ncbi:LysE family translocator [Paracoccus aminophilus]|uniref:Lysine exporter protein LysE/YggA n=1 Tax=Paracoccus aminophilus JCM 7686 TaxID=1367847 RepID=S5YBG9_PARAH|nr:LysE family transporter [Paracoccus aminophilus]AGT08798.1 lysine exporter protein LysE/YggA [Paracoccus aminophilus JCM 7686]
MAEWLAVITITALAVISPGPDFAMASRNALTQSHRAGILTALGIGAGVLVHVSYTLLGLGILLHQSPQLFAVMKVIGAAYLIWLGAKMLLRRPVPDASTTPPAPLSDGSAFRMGFWTNALNPKTAIFIISLFSQIVSAATPLATRLAYGGFVSLAHVLWFSAVALFLGAAQLRRKLLGTAHWIDRAFGLALIGFGLGLTLSDLAIA